MKAYKRIVGHVICHSLGYATPSTAARIVMKAARREQDFCEWIASCYKCDPLPAVQGAIRGRHHHKGYMAEYKLAKALVDRAVETGDEPIFASWF